MRSLVHAILVALATLVVADTARAQASNTPAIPFSVSIESREPTDVTPRASLLAPIDELSSLQENLKRLQSQLVGVKGKEQKDDELKKRVELLQKQIETQQRMIELLVEHAKKQPLAGSPVEKLQTQAATLDARSKQAAQRDQQLGQAIDNLNEHIDATERNGPRLPETLKELFLPSRTNETPLSIYGTLVAGYELFPAQRGAGRFVFDGFEPVILMQLNDHILLEAELEFGLREVEIGYAQADFIVNDWLTVVAGRYLAPIGFFNERLHSAWINKLPDFPLMARQVALDDFSLNGVQLRGASYLFGSPVKLEYSIYAANGLGLPEENELTALANLGELKETTRDVNDAMAFGGRLGFWIPEWGFNAGVSAFFNRPYRSERSPFINLWDIDVNYHKGNWDFRFEYARMFQKSPALEAEAAPAEGEAAPGPADPLRIRRRGFYAQIAYRPYDAVSRFLSSTEAVFRYSRARFSGFDQNALDLTAFESPVDAPVDRDQFTFGINYYFYPSLVVKFAYEINHERGFNLRDNVFLTQLAWGF